MAHNSSTFVLIIFTTTTIIILTSSLPPHPPPTHAPTLSHTLPPSHTHIHTHTHTYTHTHSHIHSHTHTYTQSLSYTHTHTHTHTHITRHQDPIHAQACTPTDTDYLVDPTEGAAGASCSSGLTEHRRPCKKYPLQPLPLLWQG